MPLLLPAAIFAAMFADAMIVPGAIFAAMLAVAIFATYTYTNAVVFGLGLC